MFCEQSVEESLSLGRGAERSEQTEESSVQKATHYVGLLSQLR